MKGRVSKMKLKRETGTVIKDFAAMEKILHFILGVMRSH